MMTGCQLGPKDKYRTAWLATTASGSAALCPGGWSTAMHPHSFWVDSKRVTEAEYLEAEYELFGGRTVRR